MADHYFKIYEIILTINYKIKNDNLVNFLMKL